MNKPIHGIKNMNVGFQNRCTSPSTSGLNSADSVDILKRQIFLLKSRLDKRNIKVSKVAEAYVAAA